MYDGNIFGSSSVILGNLRENVRKCSEHVWRRSSGLRNNFGKSSEIFEKWSENFRNRQKRHHQYVYITNRISHARLWIRISSFRVQLDIPRAFERCERMRYRVENSKIKFVSTRRHAISSTYHITFVPRIQLYVFLFRIATCQNFKKTNLETTLRLCELVTIYKIQIF